MSAGVDDRPVLKGLPWEGDEKEAELARTLLSSINVKFRAKAIFLASVFLLFADSGDASTIYTYDLLGRVTTVQYDNGLCIAYTYDANGNRTSQTNTIAGPPATAVWGTGVWGCFKWTP
jgi:YD repeat-containing protein